MRINLRIILIYWQMMQDIIVFKLVDSLMSYNQDIDGFFMPLIPGLSKTVTVEGKVPVINHRKFAMDPEVVVHIVGLKSILPSGTSQINHPITGKDMVVCGSKISARKILIYKIKVGSDDYSERISFTILAIGYSTKQSQVIYR